jgi:hypothetical protein
MANRKSIVSRNIEDISIVEILNEEFGIHSIDLNGELKILSDHEMPSEELLNEARKNYYQKLLANEYKSERHLSYPSIQDQLDMLYHDIKNNNLNNGEWINTIEKIKQNYPKPE